MASVPYRNVITKNVKFSTTTNLENKISEYALKIMKSRVEKAKNEAELAARKAIEDAIIGSQVYKGLIGKFAAFGKGSDLQAEFGLTPVMAERACAKMINILKNAVRFDFVEVKSGKTSRLEARGTVLEPEMYEADLKNGEEFSYVSTSLIEDKKAYERAGYRAQSSKIEWMTWLLEAGNSNIIQSTLPSIAGFGITYDLRGRDYRISRSKRALMTRIEPDVSDTTIRGTHIRKDVLSGKVTPYRMPEIARPTRGGSKNFIEDIGKDKGFKAHLTKKIEKAIFRAMKPREPLPPDLRD